MAASLAGLAFLAVTSAALLSPLAVVGQLRTDYYSTICPNLETIVRSSVKQSMAASPISAPATLRLFFHDCAVRVHLEIATDNDRSTAIDRCKQCGDQNIRSVEVSSDHCSVWFRLQGCDASIMIVNSNGDDEWRNSDNQSLKPEGFTTVLNAKAAVDSDPQCRYKVSCADILALAARESVYQVSIARNFTALRDTKIFSLNLSDFIVFKEIPCFLFSTVFLDEGITPSFH